MTPRRRGTSGEAGVVRLRLSPEDIASSLTLASVAFFAAVAAGTDLRDHPPLIQFGADPSRGILVNRTVGRRPFDPPDVARPTLIFVHGFNPTPHVVHFTMTDRLAEAVSRRFGAGLNVLGWDWNAATLVSCNRETNREETIHQGHRLARNDVRAPALIWPGRSSSRTQFGHDRRSGRRQRELLTRHGRAIAQLTPARAGHMAAHQVLFASGWRRERPPPSSRITGSPARAPGARPRRCPGSCAVPLGASARSPRVRPGRSPPRTPTISYVVKLVSSATVVELGRSPRAQGFNNQPGHPRPGRVEASWIGPSALLSLEFARWLHLSQYVGLTANFQFSHHASEDPLQVRTHTCL